MSEELFFIEIKFKKKAQYTHFMKTHKIIPLCIGVVNTLEREPNMLINI